MVSVVVGHDEFEIHVPPDMEVQTLCKFLGYDKCVAVANESLLPPYSVLNAESESSRIEIFGTRTVNTAFADSMLRVVSRLPARVQSEILDIPKDPADCGPTCAICGKKGTFLARAMSLNGKNLSYPLCRECYCQAIIQLIHRSINWYDLLRSGERLLVPISGGKDSVLLAYALHDYDKKFRPVDIRLLYMDEGIPSYSEEGRANAVNVAARLGLEITVESFENTYGNTLPDILDGYRKKSGVDYNACGMCILLKRRIVLRNADALNVTGIADGQNHSDFQRHVLQHLVYHVHRHEYAPRDTIERKKFIHPLVEVGDDNALFFSLSNGFRFRNECPYSATTGKMRKVLDSCTTELERIDPLILSGFYSKKSKNTSPVFRRRCASCGTVFATRDELAERCEECSIIEKVTQR